MLLAALFAQLGRMIKSPSYSAQRKLFFLYNRTDSGLGRCPIKSVQMRSKTSRALSLAGAAPLTCMVWWTYLVDSGELRFETHWAFLHVSCFALIALASGLYRWVAKKPVPTRAGFFDWAIKAWIGSLIVVWLAGFVFGQM